MFPIADCDNDVSDNCDHNFGTFDDFGVKIDQKVCLDIMDSYFFCCNILIA